MSLPDWRPGDSPGASPAGSISHKWARRVAVAVVGGTVCLVGLAMVVLPGPAVVVLPLGLGILGLEFAWARRWLARLKGAADGMVNGFRHAAGQRPRRDDEPPAPDT
jgi:hypothetical protein